MEEVKRLKCDPLQEIYTLIDQARSDELKAAYCRAADKPGDKVALTRLRVKLSRISKLCKEARKEILGMRKTDETEMEKYGVDEDAELTKHSDTVEMCTQCGKAVEKHGELRKCPDCGTEPFERPEEDR